MQQPEKIDLPMSVALVRKAMEAAGPAAAMEDLGWQIGLLSALPPGLPQPLGNRTGDFPSPLENAPADLRVYHSSHSLDDGGTKVGSREEKEGSLTKLRNSD